MGYITAAMKTVADCNVGDTITDDRVTRGRGAARLQAQRSRSSGAASIRSMPTISRNCARASGNCDLNDASFHYEAETSAALGFGFRCGFLGLLHLEIIQERLSREFDLDLIATAPRVVYRISHRNTNGEVMELHNPADMPDGSLIDHIEEPWIRATIMVPDDYLGNVLDPVQRAPRPPGGSHLCRQRAPWRSIRIAAQRGRVRLLRPAEIDQPRLRQFRLCDGQLRRERPRAHLHPRQHGSGRCAQLHRPPQPSPRPAAAPSAPS